PGCRFVVGLVIEGDWESWGSGGVDWSGGKWGRIVWQEKRVEVNSVFQTWEEDRYHIGTRVCSVSLSAPHRVRLLFGVNTKKGALGFSSAPQGSDWFGQPAGAFGIGVSSHKAIWIWV
nr:hypothetical protein [Tanacetum cinerariifolium]